MVRPTVRPSRRRNTSLTPDEFGASGVRPVAKTAWWEWLFAIAPYAFLTFALLAFARRAGLPVPAPVGDWLTSAWMYADHPLTALVPVALMAWALYWWIFGPRT